MRIFGNKRDTFTYRSDAQLKDALVANNAESFKYVFDRYDPLLKKNIESAFHIKSETAKKTFNRRCGELRDYLLDNDCAKLKLFDPDSASFEVWLAVVSLSFFKQTFCDENTELAKRYRNGDDAIVYQRYKNEFADRVNLVSEWNVENAMDLSQNLYIHLQEDNYRRLNTYDPSKESFDAWFKRVLHNYSIDYFKKNQKNKKEVIESGSFVRIDDETPPTWQSSILNTEDEEKEELIQTLRELLKTLEPPRYREILEDLYYEGYKYEDIAQRYQVTIANAQNIASRALKRFKVICKEHGLGL